MTANKKIRNHAVGDLSGLINKVGDAANAETQWAVNTVSPDGGSSGIAQQRKR